MAKAFDCAPEEERAGVPYGRQGWSVIDAPSTRLSLVGLRPRNPDSVSPSENNDMRGPVWIQAVEKCTLVNCNEENALMKTL
jgi:hypothetical protein